MNDLPVTFGTVLFGIVLPLSTMLATSISMFMDFMDDRSTPAVSRAGFALGFLVALIVLIDTIERMNGYTGILH
jgi:hypothetical protein